MKKAYAQIFNKSICLRRVQTRTQGLFWVEPFWLRSANVLKTDQWINYVLVYNYEFICAVLNRKLFTAD